MTKLELHKVYDFDTVKKVFEENELFDQNGYSASDYDGKEELTGGIGEEVWPLYDPFGNLWVNFVLWSCCTTTHWRCIYVCATLSASGKDEV